MGGGVVYGMEAKKFLFTVELKQQTCTNPRILPQNWKV
jgi:hypothetical protein